MYLKRIAVTLKFLKNHCILISEGCLRSQNKMHFFAAVLKATLMYWERGWTLTLCLCFEHKTVKCLPALNFSHFPCAMRHALQDAMDLARRYTTVRTHGTMRHLDDVPWVFSSVKPPNKLQGSGATENCEVSPLPPLSGSRHGQSPN